MDLTILLFLIQDGVTNGAVYALLALALVLVFAVTRVILVPQGEFVAYGALTLAMLDVGKVPGTAGLLIVFAGLALLVELWSARHRLSLKLLARLVLLYIALPGAIVALTVWLAPMKLGALPQALIAIAIVAPMGPYLYRIAFQPLAEASILVLLIAAVAAHLSMTGLCLLFFGPEGLRAAPLSTSSFSLGPIPVSGQNVAISVAALVLMLALYLFFGRTILGKALRATAVNRLGARLVGGVGGQVLPWLLGLPLFDPLPAGPDEEVVGVHAAHDRPEMVGGVATKPTLRYGAVALAAGKVQSVEGGDEREPGLEEPL